MDIELIRKTLIQDEGKRNFLYFDSKGIGSIGIGRNLVNKGLSDKEVEFLFQNDLNESIEALLSIFPNFLGFSPVRQAALISLMFAGKGTFLEFRKMIAAIKNNDWDEASREVLDSLYAKEVPNRAFRIAVSLRDG